ncbi:MAG: PfkB family carbohydrate kinase [Proteobacteria bacterium]|nr:PfkB family carbohydrate kinase [Pseudomonadota bacterium]
MPMLPRSISPNAKNTMPRNNNKAELRNLNLGACILAMQDKRVVVAGDVMLDGFVHGDINRISPEAPVPVLARSHTRYMPGGAANVARNLAHMGIATELIGVIGADEAGEQLAACLADEAGIIPRLIIDKSRPTTQKTRYTTAQQQILRVDVEETRPLDAATNKGMAKAVGEAVARQGCHGFIFSDYNKGVLSRPLIELAIESVAVQNKQNKPKIPILADPKQWQSSLFAGVDILTPNLAELTALCHSMGYTLAHAHKDGDAIDIAAINRAANGLGQHAKIKHIVTTLSADGLLLSHGDGGDGGDSNGGGDGLHITSQAKSVYDVSGAGDTVIAHLAAALAGGAGLALAAKLANYAATIVVSKAGTASVVPGELLGAVLGGEASARLYDSATAQKACAAWRSKGEAIVLTNGCFDCLHSGHLWLLTEAAKKGKRLLVAVNSDASARRLKGAGRPIQSQNMRASVIAHLPMVDGVVIFDEDTPQQLVTRLTPDVLVKGGDYQAKDVIGGGHVTKHGGQVAIIPSKKGFSTTRLVAGG